MPFTSHWITIDLSYQLMDAMYSITNHLRWITACSGNQLITDDQHTIIMSGNITFNQNIITEFSCNHISSFYLFNVHKVNRHTFALITIFWFHDYWNTYLASCHPGIFGTHHIATKWNRYSCSME